MNAGRFRHLSILWILTLIGCSDNPSTHPVFKFYPADRYFETGFVNKYYEHYYPANTSQSASTRISYQLYKKEGEQAFTVETYNAGFWLTGKQYYHVEEAQLYLDSSVNIWQTDTTVLEVDKGIAIDWNRPTDEVNYQVRGGNDRYQFVYQSQQVDIQDTLIDGIEAKAIQQEVSRTVFNADTTTMSWQTDQYYMADIGFYGLKETTNEYTWEMELVEQMPLSRFKERMKHDEHRVAYIDHVSFVL